MGLIARYCPTCGSRGRVNSICQHPEPMGDRFRVLPEPPDDPAEEHWRESLSETQEDDDQGQCTCVHPDGRNHEERFGFCLPCQYCVWKLHWLLDKFTRQGA